MRPTPERDANQSAQSGAGDPEPTVSAAPGSPGAGPRPHQQTRSGHGRGGWRSLVISMAILLGVVLLWVALLPRPSGTPRPTVDVAASAAHVSASTGTALYVPVMPSPWRATSVRVTDTAAVAGWHAGYTKDDDDRAYVAVEETSATGQASDEAWLSGIVKTATERETRTIGAQTWRVFSDGGDPERRSLVGRLGGTLVVVTGLADLDVLVAAAESLQVVPTSATAPGSIGT